MSVRAQAWARECERARRRRRHAQRRRVAGRGGSAGGRMAAQMGANVEMVAYFIVTKNTSKFLVTAVRAKSMDCDAVTKKRKKFSDFKVRLGLTVYTQSQKRKAAHPDEDPERRTGQKWMYRPFSSGMS